jgi:hypothetical protein
VPKERADGPYTKCVREVAHLYIFRVKLKGESHFSLHKVSTRRGNRNVHPAPMTEGGADGGPATAATLDDSAALSPSKSQPISQSMPGRGDGDRDDGGVFFVKSSGNGETKWRHYALRRKPQTLAPLTLNLRTMRPTPCTLSSEN